MKPVHPRIKLVAKVSAALLALDAVIVGIAGQIPAPAIVSVLAIIHTILPPLAGYLKTIE